MFEQITFGDFTEDVFIEKFEPSDVDNENVDDILSIDQIDLSSIAISATDWTTETIVSQVKKGNIVLDPDFQRRDAWTLKTKSKFIESIFLGLPIPQIILAEYKDKKGKFMVIDGKQRLLSLMQFVLGYGNGNYLKLSGLDVKSYLNKLTYDNILHSEFRDEIDAFNNQTIRTVVLKSWPNVQALYLIFQRLNTGSVRLSPQELRQSLYPGKFIKFANDHSANNLQIKQMLNLKAPDFRMRDVEIFIRYYAFKYFYSRYSGSMQSFLDETCKTLNQLWDEREDEIVADEMELSNAINATYIIFGAKYAFRKYKGMNYEDKFNRSVVDIMVYYFSIPEIRKQAVCQKAEIKGAFEAMAEDKAFLASIEFTTKSIASVSTRFEKWGQRLSEILGIEIDIPEITK